MNLKERINKMVEMFVDYTDVSMTEHEKDILIQFIEELIEEIK